MSRNRLPGTIVLSLLLLAAFPSIIAAADESHPLAGLPMRSIGPALTSGRVSDFAFHPDQWEVHYVGFASGNLWKTGNNGASWEAVFENEGSYAIGVVELDPSNSSTVWVGTGENNAQRSVAFGDGVYKSMDAGKTWKNMGLKDSGHISMIRIHPENSNIVWVAAQGPLWNSGGDRGLYKTIDGGESWTRILEIDEDTGVNEFVMHSANPDVIVASSYQRRRHVWTLINGGPGGGVHKTVDGGKTWRKISQGIPGGDLGRIGLAAAPSAPNILYAIIEADDKGKGVYRSTDFGESWEKRSDRMTSSPQYYNELYVDPNDPDVVYSVDTFTSRSEDGGKTWSRISIKNRHVDDHALWIDPANSNHLYIGGDGGVYESWDRGENWRHVSNLPMTQFYRGTPDNDAPFYNVCGGTQDNFTLCGPVQTRFTDGITNVDWWIAQFGDGFKAQIDPTDANVVYAQYQYGGLARFDRVTGERLAITPQPGAEENKYKWNWNAPLIISPHNSNRLYYGAERLFRSDDRGESWVAVSGDLSRQIDRNKLDVMGRVWSVDAIAKNMSTSMYGSLIALAESPLTEGLIYAGTDDGLIQVTTDGGNSWRKTASFKGVPDMSLVEDIIASSHDADVAYAVFDNHKRGDHKPYVVKTSDRGKNWKMMVDGLPPRGTAHTIIEDHVNSGLLFVGTEFGLFFTQDGGGNWQELTGLPTIAVRDLEIQRRESDLVVTTFGRGFYILDDIAPLRTPVKQLESGASLFPVRDSWIYNPDRRRGWGGKGDFGSDRYTADNPPYGAVFSYYLAEDLQSIKDKRRDSEKERAKAGEDNPYPSWEQLRREDREEAPSVTLTVTDRSGQVIRRIDGPAGKGFHRVAWDMRYPAPDPVNLQPATDRAPWEGTPQGPMVLPGQYSVTLSKRVEGKFEEIAGAQTFTLKPLFTGGLVADDREAVLQFQSQTAELYRAVMGADRAADEIQTRIDHLVKAVEETPAATEAQATAVRRLNARMQDLRVILNGDRTVTSRAEAAPQSIFERVAVIVGGSWGSQSAVSGNFRESYRVATEQFPPVLAELSSISADLVQLENELEAEGAPWTPARLPEWSSQ
ncbi:MAG: glycosyl hydrolase [Xanthomonadales bacterium]|nr:glycosyl hydrolase [Gammaproteobacteria bacterium]NND58291.1 glycosyl hydrolase [Xanthomonadales bacterium]NNK51998.1 glycosyl hydrolase [Xanthomonadales bacterium]